MSESSLTPETILAIMQKHRHSKGYYHSVLVTLDKYFTVTVRFSTEESLTEDEATTIVKNLLKRSNEIEIHSPQINLPNP